MNNTFTWSPDELYHHGIKGQKWGIRRYQNPDGSLTEAGKRRYDLDTKKGIRKMAKDLSRLPWSTNEKDRSYHGLAESALEKYAVNKYSDRYKTLFDKKRRETNADAYRVEDKIREKYDLKEDAIDRRLPGRQAERAKDKLADKRFQEMRVANLRVLKKHGYKSIDQIQEENFKAYVEQKQLLNDILEKSKKVKLTRRKLDAIERYTNMTVRTGNFINWGY